MGNAEQPYLSIVIPAYNEAIRIVPTLQTIAAYMESETYAWEVIVVDDGSVDGTADLVESWTEGRDNIHVSRRPHHGKGWAVRSGMLSATGRYRFMCDADLAMPIQSVSEFLIRMEDGADVVIGSREVDGARRFDEPTYRHLMGRVFNWTVKLLAVRGIEDTQCGFKCFRAEAASKLFRLQRTEGMGFDVEILYLARKMGFAIEEIPIDWYHQAGSKVRPGVDTFDMLKDTILVRLRDMVRKYR